MAIIINGTTGITFDDSTTLSTTPTLTQEALVWVDEFANRAFDTVYTNTNDVPLYVQIYTYSNASGENAQMWVDGVFFGAIGNTSGTTQLVNTNLYIIPSNSTYELKQAVNAPEIKEWHEAPMPFSDIVTS